MDPIIKDLEKAEHYTNCVLDNGNRKSKKTMSFLLYKLRLLAALSKNSRIARREFNMTYDKMRDIFEVHHQKTIQRLHESFRPMKKRWAEIERRAARYAAKRRVERTIKRLRSGRQLSFAVLTQIVNQFKTMRESKKNRTETADDRFEKLRGYFDLQPSGNGATIEKIPAPKVMRRVCRKLAKAYVELAQQIRKN